jgi:hypothetical protein
MGEEVTQTEFSGAHRQEYRRKVQLCLDVFENMLNQASFEFDRPLTGMEIECNLVDNEYQPAMSNSDVLASCHRGHCPARQPSNSSTKFAPASMPLRARRIRAAHTS